MLLPEQRSTGVGDSDAPALIQERGVTEQGGK